MQQTQVVRDILQVAKGMLPASQQSTQNIKSLEEMARNLVAQKSFGTGKPKEDSSIEDTRKRVDEKIKDERNYIQQSTLNSSRQVFYEKFEAICGGNAGLGEHPNGLVKKPRICVVGMQGSGKSELIEALVGIPFAFVNLKSK